MTVTPETVAAGATTVAVCAAAPGTAAKSEMRNIGNRMGFPRRASRESFTIFSAWNPRCNALNTARAQVRVGAFYSQAVAGGGYRGVGKICVASMVEVPDLLVGAHSSVGR